MKREGAALVDGRHERQVKTRALIIRAALDLMRECDEIPLIETVAKRAGVSRRSIFRLFTDVEALYRAAAELNRAEVVQLFPPPFPERATRKKRVKLLVEHRSKVYEHIAPTRRVAERVKHQSAIIRTLQAQANVLFEHHVAAILGPYLQPQSDTYESTLKALSVATSWTVWNHLREDLGLSVDSAKALVTQMAHAILQAKSR